MAKEPERTILIHHFADSVNSHLRLAEMLGASETQAIADFTDYMLGMMALCGAKPEDMRAAVEKVLKKTETEPCDIPTTVIPPNGLPS